jgi:hypothetical protein
MADLSSKVRQSRLDCGARIIRALDRTRAPLAESLGAPAVPV